MSNLPHQIILVTGPARSGKSEWAEYLAQQSGKTISYIATAQCDPDDREWLQRIEQHRQRRPQNWKTIEDASHLASILLSATSSDCLLIDSLGTWLSSRLEEDATTWEQTQRTFAQSLKQTVAHVILVSEETGWGIVPAYPLGRLFRDRLGQLTRTVGTIADAVYLVTVGYAINLKQFGVAVPDSFRP